MASNKTTTTTTPPPTTTSTTVTTTKLFTTTEDYTTTENNTTTAQQTIPTVAIAIGGSVVGLVVVVLIVTFVTLLCKSRRCKRKKHIAPPPSKADVENPNFWGKNKYSKEPKRSVTTSSSQEGASVENYADAVLPDNTAIIKQISQNRRKREKKQKKDYENEEVIADIARVGPPKRKMTPPVVNKTQENYLSPSEVKSHIQPQNVPVPMSYPPDITVDEPQDFYENTQFGGSDDDGIYQNESFGTPEIFPASTIGANNDVAANFGNNEVHADDIYQNTNFDQGYGRLTPAREQFGSSASVDSYYMTMTRDGTTAASDGLTQNSIVPPAPHDQYIMEPIYGNQ